MEKINIWGYWVRNLGDDLFLRVVCDYLNSKGIEPTIACRNDYVEYYKQFGCNVLNQDSFWYKIASHLFQLDPLFIFARRRYFLLLGGSLFAENKKEDIEERQRRCLAHAAKVAKSTAIISSNFGPYKTDRFFNFYSQLFSSIADICFRDLNSYNTFSRLKNCHYAPDLVLSGLWEKDVNYNEYLDYAGSVIISVMDFSNRLDLKRYHEKYINTIKQIIKYHLEAGDKLTLVAFCEKEGDLNVCKSLKKCFPEDRISVLEYSSINMAVAFKTAKKVYATRFHSIILSIYYSVRCIPIIYNEKSLNAILSYCCDMYYFQIESLNESSWKMMTDCEGSYTTVNDLKSQSMKQLNWLNGLK